MVLLLLNPCSMPRHPAQLPAAAALALLVGVVLVSPAAGAERTFVWSAGDLVSAIDDFNAAVLERSASLGRAVKIRRGTLSLAGKPCPSLAADPTRVVTRVRVLDGPARAALLAGRRSKGVLDEALASMGGVLWFPPAVGRVRQPSWVAQPVVAGVAEFATAGYASREQAGALTTGTLAEYAASFFVRVSVYGSIGTRKTGLVLAVTTELPPSRPGRRAKRNECYILLPVEAADVRALVDLLAATSPSSNTHNRLTTSLDYAMYWLDKDQPQRAARNVKRFAGDVSSLPATEMPTDAGQAMVLRALATMEALGF